MQLTICPSPLVHRIFEIAPGAWKMFPFGQDYETCDDAMFQEPSFQKHAKQVVGMLDSAVHFLGPDLSTLEDALIQLGARHTTYGVLPEHYPIVGQALLGTLEAALGKEVFNKQLQEAWAALYGFVTSSMLQGANEALLRLSFPVYNGKDCEEDAKQEKLSLDAYVSAMLPGQKQLFYTTASNSSSITNNATANANMTKLQSAGIVVLSLPKRKVDMIVGSLNKYVGRKLVNVDDSDLDLAFLVPFGAVPGLACLSDDEDSSESLSSTSSHSKSSSADHAFCDWFQSELGQDKVVKCTPTCQYTSLPARVVPHCHNKEELMRQLEDFDCMPLPKKHVEINPNHPLIQTLSKLRRDQPAVARMIAEQVYDNCLIQAGLLDEGRAMVHRINELCMMVMTTK